MTNTKPSDAFLWRLSAAAACVAAFLVALPVGAAASMPRPDLKVAAIDGTGSLGPGSTSSVIVTTRNGGRRRARRTSKTALYLSRDDRASADDIRVGSTKVPRLRPRRSVKRVLGVTVPTAAPALARLLACADATRRVRESRERNNCRAVATVIGGPTPMGPGPDPGGPGRDDDRDGYPNWADCDPYDAGTHPGAEDRPDVPALRDTNCDGVDGDAAAAIFVSPTGDDTNPGTRERPKATFGTAVVSAEEQGKDVYATQGTYVETLRVPNGVSVYGGYAADWSRSLDNRTRLAGIENAYGIAGAVAVDVSKPTRLQLVRLEPTAPQRAGASAYGLRGFGDTGLTVERVVAIAPAGHAGAAGADGAAGAPGQPGGRGGATGGCDRAGAGGASGVPGHSGGSGGYGGYDSKPGDPGAQGLLRPPGDSHGQVGGLGGLGGSGTALASRGRDGDAGFRGIDGAGGLGGQVSAGEWYGAPGQNGTDGDPGHGGGGGGGGGSDSSTHIGGGGGGGGRGAGGGQRGGPGTAGGGSFAFFVPDGSATIQDSVATASTGGAGGAGGTGGYLGPGGPGGDGIRCISGGQGGRGGNGGVGGLGGSGGGGAGGPSVAFYGLPRDKTPGSTASHGAGGPGGNSLGFHGAPGAAADYL